jgi:predicted acyl esterase
MRLPTATTEYTVTRGIRVPMRDGVDLLADHYAPTTSTPAGTILVRGLYGRGGLASVTGARVYAARGYHVVLQSVRGTFGSGGEFAPGRHEADDGADTVAWLRTQPWFTGRFATMGSSYLGYTQWALLVDPPPELATAIISVGPHDMSAAAWATGAFALNDFLGWSDLVARQEDGRVKPFVVGLLGHWRVNPAMRALPLGEAGRRLLRDGAPWYEDGSDTRIRRTSIGVPCDRPPRWIWFRSRCC